MKTYQEKLMDPRWQKKRLEIFSRDKWKCTKCGRDDLELHVHHLRYDGEPWQTKDENFKTLCHQCHAIIHSGVDFTNVKKTIRETFLI